MGDYGMLISRSTRPFTGHPHIVWKRSIPLFSSFLRPHYWQSVYSRIPYLALAFPCFACLIACLLGGVVGGCLDGVDSEPRLGAHGGIFGRGGWDIDGWIIDECEMIDTPPPHFEARSFMNYVFLFGGPFLLFGVRKGQARGKARRRGMKKRKRKRKRKEYHLLKIRRRRK